MNKKIYLSPPHMSGNELKYIHDAFDKNWIAPLGENVDKFEESLTSYLNIAHATVLSSGTAALHLALINLGVKKDDEVIVSTFTFSASVNPIIYQAATPIFVDSETETWNMDPELLEDSIKDRIRRGKTPKAIILVYLYGMPAKISEIFTVAEKYGIPIIEDAAEALGSRYDSKHVGTFGQMGILSFNGNKIITSSGGGALISNNKEYNDHALFLATQARDDEPHYEHSSIGYNYRMSNIIAGIGRGQMEVIDERVEQRRKNFKFYEDQLSEYDSIDFLKEPARCFSNYWLTTILLDEQVCRSDELRRHLFSKNIESRPLWKPMHLQPIFRDFPVYENGTSEKLFNKGLCLPSGSNLTMEDKIFVVGEIRKKLDG